MLSRVGDRCELVVTKIEHSEMVQSPDTFGEVLQPVVGKDQRLELDPVPHGLGDATEMLPPEIQTGRRVAKRHGSE